LNELRSEILLRSADKKHANALAELYLLEQIGRIRHKVS